METAEQAAQYATRAPPPDEKYLRSCTPCAKRKVRCDRGSPCSNCDRFNKVCVYPGPRRPPTKVQKEPNDKLLARIRKLEALVAGDGPGTRDATRTESSSRTSNKSNPDLDELSAVEDDREDMQPADPTALQGRLLTNDRQSHYIGNSLWRRMVLDDEGYQMQDLLESSRDDQSSASNQGVTRDTASALPSRAEDIIFGNISSRPELRSIKPSASQMYVLWMVFEENVDPVVKILHLPSTKTMYLGAAGGDRHLSQSEDLLLWAIFFSALTSLSDSRCLELLGETKENLLRRYRYGVENALADVRLLNTSDFQVLQAFVLFLVCVRDHDSTRLVWSLSGLAIVLAQGQGLHRDGTHLGLSSYETEMRRRLWWHITAMNNRGSEDHGATPLITPTTFDTRLPLNINDEDIDPEVEKTPVSRHGITEMTFSIIRFESVVLKMRLEAELKKKKHNNSSAKQHSKPLDPIAIIDQAQKQVYNKYLQQADSKTTLYRLIELVNGAIMRKLRLMFHDRALNPETIESVSRNEPMLITAIGVIEDTVALRNDPNMAKWLWFLRTQAQWFTIIYVLAGICSRGPDQVYQRAWRALDGLLALTTFNKEYSKQGMIWKPMQRLFNKAQQRREEHESSQSNVTDSLSIPNSQGVPLDEDVFTMFNDINFPDLNGAVNGSFLNGPNYFDFNFDGASSWEFD